LGTGAVRAASVAAAVIGGALAAAAPAAAAECESWNNGSEIRCLAQGQAAFDGATVVVHNFTLTPVYFDYEEWQSRCGVMGRSTHRAQAEIPAETKVRFGLGPTMQAHISGETNMCNELFFFGCRLLESPDRHSVDCPNFLEAWIE
jgi:hypothetical protein